MGVFGGGVLDLDKAGVRSVQGGGLLALGPGLESGTDYPNKTCVPSGSRKILWIGKFGEVWLGRGWSRNRC